MKTLKNTVVALAFATLVSLTSLTATANESDTRNPATQVLYGTVKIDGLDIFYREAGPKDAPTVLLLHGFPTSSHMFRNLIPALADEYHVVAPDYPGYGNSSAPSVEDFEYTFDNLANVVEKFTEKVGLKEYSIYLMDYGAPVGFRLAGARLGSSKMTLNCWSVCETLTIRGRWNELSCFRLNHGT